MALDKRAVEAHDFAIAADPLTGDPVSREMTAYRRVYAPRATRLQGGGSLASPQISLAERLADRFANGEDAGGSAGFAKNEKR